MQGIGKYGTAVLATLAMLGGAWWIGFSMGQDSVQSEWDKERQAVTEAQSTILINGINETYKLGLQYEEQKIEVHYVTNTLVKKIPDYMPDTSSCRRLPPGFGRLYNEAASIAVGDPAFRKLDAAGAAALLD